MERRPLQDGPLRQERRGEVTLHERRHDSARRHRYAHIHVDFEVMLYILEGKVRHEYGPDLSLSIDNEAGDFIFIEPDVPHEVLDLNDAEKIEDGRVTKPDSLRVQVDRAHRRTGRIALEHKAISHSQSDYLAYKLDGYIEHCVIASEKARELIRPPGNIR